MGTAKNCWCLSDAVNVLSQQRSIVRSLADWSLVQESRLPNAWSISVLRMNAGLSGPKHSTPQRRLSK